MIGVGVTKSHFIANYEHYITFYVPLSSPRVCPFSGGIPANPIHPLEPLEGDHRIFQYILG